MCICVYVCVCVCVLVCKCATARRKEDALTVCGVAQVKPGKNRQHGGFGIGTKNNKNGGRKGRDSSG